MLTLPIKRVWFDMILSGKKKEEYRKISPKYTATFHNAMDDHGCFWCRLRNGYRLDSPSILAYVRLSTGKGRPEWGADPGQQYFVLSILRLKKE